VKFLTLEKLISRIFKSHC